MAFIEQKENDNNDNLCKIHGGLYITSAVINCYWSYWYVLWFFCLVFTASAKWRLELRAKIGQYRNRCFLWFFLHVLYIYKELSILISFNRVSLFSHISKSPATIVYPCYSHTFHKNSHLENCFRFPGLKQYKSLQLFMEFFICLWDLHFQNVYCLS